MPLWSSKPSKHLYPLLAVLLVVGTFSIYIHSIRATLEQNKASNKLHYDRDSSDDIAVFTPSAKYTKARAYDGGKGMDVLWLRLTRDEYDDPIFQADLIRYVFHMSKHGDPKSKLGEGNAYSFSSLDLTVQNFERLKIDIIAPGEPFAFEQFLD